MSIFLRNSMLRQLHHRGVLCALLYKQIHEYVYSMYGMGHKKVPVFRNTLTCNGKFAFVFASVPFYNFRFYCCVSILKAQCKER